MKKAFLTRSWRRNKLNSKSAFTTNFHDRLKRKQFARMRRCSNSTGFPSVVLMGMRRLGFGPGVGGWGNGTRDGACFELPFFWRWVEWTGWQIHKRPEFSPCHEMWAICRTRVWISCRHKGQVSSCKAHPMHRSLKETRMQEELRRFLSRKSVKQTLKG